jgi:hypothetical protein
LEKDLWPPVAAVCLFLAIKEIREINFLRREEIGAIEGPKSQAAALLCTIAIGTPRYTKMETEFPDEVGRV